MINIGTQGTFRAITPFKIVSDVLTCVAKSSLSALRRQGVDVYASYEQAGISKDAFNTYIDDIILTLSSPSGEVYYYPEDKLLRVDHTNHIPYVRKAAVIDLGVHPTTKTFNVASDRLKAMFEEIEGVQVSPVVKDISLQNYLSVEDHKNLVHTRRRARDSDSSVRNLLVSKDDQIVLMGAQIKALIKFISRYLEGCCNNSVCWQWGAEVTDMVQYEQTLDNMVANTEDQNPFMGHTHAWSYHLTVDTDLVITGGPNE